MKILKYFGIGAVQIGITIIIFMVTQTYWAELFSKYESNDVITLLIIFIGYFASSFICIIIYIQVYDNNKKSLFIAVISIFTTFISWVWVSYSLIFYDIFTTPIKQLIWLMIYIEPVNFWYYNIVVYCVFCTIFSILSKNESKVISYG